MVDTNFNLGVTLFLFMLSLFYYNYVMKRLYN